MSLCRITSSCHPPSKQEMIWWLGAPSTLLLALGLATREMAWSTVPRAQVKQRAWSRYNSVFLLEAKQPGFAEIQRVHIFSLASSHTKWRKIPYIFVPSQHSQTQPDTHNYTFFWWRDIGNCQASTELAGVTLCSPLPSPLEASRQEAGKFFKFLQ